MTDEHQTTPEEEAYWRLVDEKWDELSEAARAVWQEADGLAHAQHLVNSYCVQLQEFDEADERMKHAAADLTDRDCELLRDYVRAAMRACASVDRFDFVTSAGWRVYSADLHRYYLMMSGMATDALRHRRHLISMERLAQEPPIDESDIPF